ncbi:MAG: hypothetical protein JWM16_6256, partial [Verrucomicrobiales bacterium]|nr:hypothetical protein [Verrucomicrobiales bacterium]
ESIPRYKAVSIAVDRRLPIIQN